MKHYDSLEAFLGDLPALAEAHRDKLRGQNGIFALTTRQGKQLWACLVDGLITLPETAPSQAPECVVTADEKDLLDIINGELSPVRAILFGKIRIKGNKGLLLKLASMA